MIQISALTSSQKLREEIILLVGTTTAATIDLLHEQIKEARRVGRATGPLEVQLWAVRRDGPRWEPARFLGELRSPEICRELSRMERDGLIVRFNPTGRRTQAVKLTELGEQHYRDLVGEGGDHEQL